MTDFLHDISDSCNIIHAATEDVIEADIAPSPRSSISTRASGNIRFPYKIGNVIDATTFADYLPHRMRTSDNLKNGTWIASRHDAIAERYIAFNGQSRVWWLTFDMDCQDAFEAFERAKLPTPNVWIGNPREHKNFGRGHYGYALALPIHTTSASRLAPLAYLAAIQRGMTRRLGADPCYAGLMGKNPLHPYWRTAWLHRRTYMLEELGCDLSASDKAKQRRTQAITGLGRNCDLFRATLRTCAPHASKYWLHGVGAFVEHVKIIVHELNALFDNPLPRSEVNSIAKSSAKWLFKNADARSFSAVQSARARSQSYGNRKVIAELSRENSKRPRVTADGRKLTAAELAAAMVGADGLSSASERTAQRYWAQQRAEYEATSLMKTKPWEECGVSRATWYRQQRDQTNKTG